MLRKTICGLLSLAMLLTAFGAVVFQTAEAAADQEYITSTVKSDDDAKIVYSGSYKVTARSADESKGSVSVSKSAPYYENDEVVFTAEPAGGYMFAGWYKIGETEMLSDSEKYTLIVSSDTQGEYVAKFISAEFYTEPLYELDIDGALEDPGSLPGGITLNGAALDSDGSSADGGLKSNVSDSAQSLLAINFEELQKALKPSGPTANDFKVVLAVNVKDADDNVLNGTNLFAVNNGGSKQLLSASESRNGVRASTGSGMNGGGDSYRRDYVTYTFDFNVKNGTLTSTITDQADKTIFSSVAAGQTVTVPGISGSDPVTRLDIMNIAGERANIRSLAVSQNIAEPNYGEDVPVFNEMCVSLIGADGEKLSGPAVSAAVKRIEINFKSVLKESTVTKDTIYLEKDGTKLDIYPIHCDGTVAFDVDGLEPNSTYTLNVTSDIESVRRRSVRSAGTYSFTTGNAECRAEIASVSIGGAEPTSIADISENDRIDVAVNYVNTYADPGNVYVVYTAYKNNTLADIKIAERAADSVGKSFTQSFTAGDMTGVTSIKIFAFDNWDSQNVLDSAAIGGSLNYAAAESTGIKVDTSANKIIVSAAAGADDELWIEAVMNGKNHGQVLDGLTKTDDIYSEAVPLAFFDTVTGGFAAEIEPEEPGDCTVYVKNLSSGEMLIDGTTVAFTDSAGYAALVNSLDTSSADAFANSLTDEKIKQLRLDALTDKNLTEAEKNAVKAKLYAEGLSATDSEFNKRMCSEYAAMQVINSRASASSDLASRVISWLDDTVSADADLRSWYDKYVSNLSDETEFVNKLFATEPASAGSDKVASRSALSDAVKVALVLKIAEAPDGYTNIGSAFNQFKSAFGRSSVSSASSVYREMIGTYANKTEFLKKYDSLAASSGSGSGGGSGGGFGGGSGGGSGYFGGYSTGDASHDFMIEHGSGGLLEGDAAASAAAPMEKDIFTDIGSVPWAREAIVNLRVKNVISGKTLTEFFPNDNITREEFTKLIAAAFAGDAPMAELTFEDADPSEWYYPFIQRAKGAGLVKGISDIYFGIGQNITRQDMAVMIFNAAAYKNVISADSSNEFPFIDDADIADYAKEAVYALKATGIVNGVDADHFAPLSAATRAEAAVMIYRLLLK